MAEKLGTSAEIEGTKPLNLTVNSYATLPQQIKNCPQQKLPVEADED
jgi:hypothetical protein